MLSHKRSLISIYLPAWICWTSLRGTGRAEIDRLRPPEVLGDSQSGSTDGPVVGCDPGGKARVGVPPAGDDPTLGPGDPDSRTEARAAGAGRDPKGGGSAREGGGAGLN